MSYCRWSSDNWKCDVYCYEDAQGGWTTHVAARKRIGLMPECRFPTENTPDAIERFAIDHKPQLKALDEAELTPIGLPYDGETFSDPTLEDFRDRLTMLKNMGYNVPGWVFQTVEAELAEQ